MTEQALREELLALGVDAETWRALLLLPMIQVAWADGSLQRAELSQITRAADELGPGVAQVVEGWLTSPPSAELGRRGGEVLAALTQRHRGLGSDLPADTLQRVLEQCEALAASAGGLFGVLFTVDARERATLGEIARTFRLTTEGLLAELPGPGTGVWQEL